MSGFLKITSMNCNWLRNIDKLKAILKQPEGDIFCFKWLTGLTKRKMKYQSCGKLRFFSVHSSIKSCGVAIMLRGNRVKDEKFIYSDSNDRLLETDFCLTI